MQKGLIGIIVPVYKTEKYIAECIDSILAQTYTKFRLVLVDDGTPDGAGAICDQYAAKDNRITVIHQKNAGVTRARARGVEDANDCEWITFVDSDDTIAPTAIEEFTESANNEIDIVAINYHSSLYYHNELSINDYREYLITETLLPSDLWGKLFKRKLFDKFIFDIPRSIVVAEDRIANIRLSFKTNKNIHLINNRIYHYRIYQESTFHSHIRTPENEHEVYTQEFLSFPEQFKDEYTQLTINPRLLRSKEMWGYKYNVKEMLKTQFYINLCADIKRYNYNLSFYDRINLMCTNPIIRFIAINVKKILNKMEQP